MFVKEIAVVIRGRVLRCCWYRVHGKPGFEFVWCGLGGVVGCDLVVFG